MTEELVCYCFRHTAADIVRDVMTHGRSTIRDEILAAKKAGGCQCATKNPKGRRVADSAANRAGDMT